MNQKEVIDYIDSNIDFITLDTIIDVTIIRTHFFELQVHNDKVVILDRYILPNYEMLNFIDNNLPVVLKFDSENFIDNFNATYNYLQSAMSYFEYKENFPE